MRLDAQGERRCGGRGSMHVCCCVRLFHAFFHLDAFQSRQLDLCLCVPRPSFRSCMYEPSHHRPLLSVLLTSYEEARHRRLIVVSRDIRWPARFRQGTCRRCMSIMCGSGGPPKSTKLMQAKHATLASPGPVGLPLLACVPATSHKPWQAIV